MSKASTEPLRIRQSEKDLPVALTSVLDRFQNITVGMNLADMQHDVQLLLEHCGESAYIQVLNDEYWGSDASLTWHRTETPLEVERRHSANAKRRATMRAKKPVVDKKKRTADLAELARLQKIYGVTA